MFMRCSVRGSFCLMSLDRHRPASHRGSWPLSARRVLWNVLPAFVGALGMLALAPVSAEAGRSHYSPPKAAMVIDAHTGKVLYQHNADAPRYPASITKVMTLYLLFERLREGQMDMDTRLTVSAYAAAKPPSKLGLKAGSTITVRDAIRALVTKSANDVAAVIAENLAGSETKFAALMTAKARSLGMKNTTFRNASGLPDSDQQTTARDLITLGQRISKDFPKLSKEFQRRYFKYRGRVYRNHNRLLSTYKGVDGFKTGFIRASGFNVLTSARRAKKHLIAVVLGGRSARARDARMRKLLDKAWPKAITLDQLKRRQRLAASALPARNPAFRASRREKLIRDQLIAARQNPSQRSVKKLEQRLADSPFAGQLAQYMLAHRSEDMAQGSTDEPGQQVAPALKVETAEQPAEAVKEGRGLAGPYHLQVGAYTTAEDARRRLEAVSKKAGSILQGFPADTVHVELSGRDIYRARFGGFERSKADSACKLLRKRSIDCLVSAAN